MFSQILVGTRKNFVIDLAQRWETTARESILCGPQAVTRT